MPSLHDVEPQPQMLAMDARHHPHFWRLLVPREHGAWGLWILPLVSGVVVGWWAHPGAGEQIFWVCIAAAAAFIVHHPLEGLLGMSLVRVQESRERRILKGWTAVLALLMLAALSELLWLGRPLVLLFGVFAGMCFFAKYQLGRGRERMLQKEIIGAFGLTCTGAVGYYAATGTVGKAGTGIWLASFFFAIAQISYVQLRLKTATAAARYRRRKQVVAVLALQTSLLIFLIEGAASGFLPALVPAVFTLPLIQTLVWSARAFVPLRVHRLGTTELIQSIGFTAVLTVSFLLQI